MDFENLILEKQEAISIMEDADDLEDECGRCPLLSECKKASEGKGEYPVCPSLVGD